MNCKHREYRVCNTCKRNEQETRFTPSNKYICSECCVKRQQIVRNKKKEQDKKIGNIIESEKKCTDCGKTDKEAEFYESMTRVCVKCFKKRAEERMSSHKENQFAREWNKQHPYKFDMLHRIVKQLAVNA